MGHVHPGRLLWDSGNWIHCLADDGELHVCLVEDQPDGIEDIEWSEEVQSLETRKDKHGIVSRQYGGIRERGSLRYSSEG